MARPMNFTRPVLADNPGQISLSGWLIIGLAEPDLTPAFNVYTLTDDQGQSTRLFFDQGITLPVANVEALQPQYVTVKGQWTAAYVQSQGSRALQVQAIEPVPSEKIHPAEITTAAITGAQPWVWILCKFSDDPSEPEPKTYFEDLRDDLNPYFQETSYNKANINGSAVAGWYSLPQPRSYYVYDMDSDGFEDLDFERAAGDCTNVANPDVNFSNIYGLNLMFNGELDSSFGVTTGIQLTLDGVTKFWPSVFIDNKGGYNMALTAHEMYHGFGLDHSAVRQASGGPIAGSSWDPVGLGACGFNNCTPSHIPAPQKDELGWLDANKKYTATQLDQTITLEALALPQSSNYLMAILPVTPDHFYTIEARRPVGLYDGKVPGPAVLIHEVNRSGAFFNGHIGLIPVPGKSDPGGTGAMWTVGDKFTAVSAGMEVSILAATATGFQIRIKGADLVQTYLPLIIH